MIALMSDTGCGLSQDQLRLYGIREVPSYICFDEKSYFSCDINYQNILDWVETNNRVPSIVEPTIDDWEQAISETLEQADELLILHTPPTISKLHINLKKAVQNVSKTKQNSRIELVDPKIAGYGMGALLMQLVDMLENQKTMDDLINYASNFHDQTFSRFFIGSPEYLKKAGQLNSIASFLISLLNLKPIIGYKDGHIIPVGQTIGLERAIHSILKDVKPFVAQNSQRMSLSFVYSYGMHEEVEVMRDLASKFGMNAYYDNGSHLGHVIEFAATGPSAVGVVVTPEIH